MSLADLSVNFFVALFALIDPVGNVPIFAAATAGLAAGSRRMVALYIALFAMAFMTFFFFSGGALLEFFGISMPAFRIAGGVLLFILGLEMARDDFTAKFADTASADEVTGVRGTARRRFEKLIVPFGMPLLIGPGAISSVIIYGAQAERYGWRGGLAGAGVIAAVAVTVLIAFLLSGLIGRLLGRIGMTIIVRVLGLILCAMAVQFIIAGVGEATRGVVRPSAAAPYADK